MDADGLARLWHYGNYDDYGQLLAERRVRILDQHDAETVWTAFNELNLKQWGHAPPIRRSATVWDLGDNTRDGVHYHFEVRLDEGGFVVSGRLRSEKV